MLNSILRHPATRRGLALAAGVSTLTGVSGVLLLAVAGWFLTGAALAGAAGPAAALAFNYLLPSALIRLLAITRTVGRYGERYLSHRAALLAMAELRAGLFRSLAGRDPRHEALPSEGEAAARLTGDVEAVEALLVRKPLQFGAWASAVAALIAALLAGWRAALAVSALIAGLTLLLPWLAARLTQRPSARSAQALGQWRSCLAELAAARAEIAAYGLADQAMATLEPSVVGFEAACRQLARAQVLLGGLVQIGGGVAVLLVLALGRGSAPGIALAGLSAVAGVEALGALVQAGMHRARAEEGLRRLAELEEAPSLDCQRAPSGGGLRLGDQNLVPGARVALAGISGSGKTTVLETLAGLRGDTVRAGLGTVSAGRVALPELSALFAISPQSAPVIIGTIADNLRVARSGVDDAAMWQVLEVACLAERVRAFPHVLEEQVGAGGLALSGGERKRLSLARALLAGRPWLLLDEPTEGLDAATEAELVTRLRGWLDRGGAGLILASHRAAPMALADQVVEAVALTAKDAT
jgi:ATP-binding cassette subfamily C protein CydC